MVESRHGFSFMGGGIVICDFTGAFLLGVLAAIWTGAANHPFIETGAGICDGAYRSPLRKIYLGSDAAG